MLAFSSCEGFLDKFPETSLSPETFYTSEKELELATNGFYTMLPSPDDKTDGALQDNDLEYHISLSSLQMGNRSAENESWSSSTWSNLRALNYYLEHSVNCTSEDIRKNTTASPISSGQCSTTKRSANMATSLGMTM